MKHLANAFSVARIILIVPLLLSAENGFLFTILYLVIGLTDLLDGWIARKTDTATAFGAKLDTVADLLFFSAVIYLLFRLAGGFLHQYLVWFIAILAIRLVGVLVAVLKYHSFVILHTLGNKITGLLLFAAPLFLFYGCKNFIPLVFVVAGLSAVEEVLIHLTAKEPDRDRKSLL